MQHIKILQVIRPVEGGMKEHLLSLIRGLNKETFCIEAACPKDSSVAKQLKKEGVKVVELPLAGSLNIRQDLSCIKAIVELCRHNNYKLVHCHGSKAGLVGRLAASRARVPVIVLTAHNFILSDNMPILKKSLFSVGEKYLGGKTDVIITVSNALKMEYVKKFGQPPEKVTCIYNGIDSGKFECAIDICSARASFGLANSPLVFGTIARMAPQKGLRFFLEAAAILQRKIEAYFIIAGDGSLRPELENYAHQLGLHEKVRFPGYCDNINEVLQSIDILVIPSISEGLSITAIEAMAAGRPIVASRVGGLPEVIDHHETGILVPPGDAEALAEAMYELAVDPELAKKLGGNGRIVALEKFSLDNMVKRTGELYLQLLGIQ